jgi:hypothetical protein
MARIRTIKPEFATSAQTAAVSRDARLMFALMWCHCDDGGVHPASGHKLKAECFPLDTDVLPETCSDWALELVKVGLLAEFEADGKVWWKVTGWKHQKIVNPSIKFPQSGQSVVISSEDSRQLATSSEDSRQLATSCESYPPEGKGREGKGVSVPSGPHPPDGGNPPDQKPGIISTWNALAKEIGCTQITKVSSGRKRKLQIRLKEPAFNWPEILAKARESKGLHGQGWFSLDWLIANDTNYLKLLEGKYRNEIGARVQTHIASILPVGRDLPGAFEA